MFEALIAAAVTMGLLGLALAAVFIRWAVILAIGAATTAVFFFASLPIGLFYHLALYRALRPQGTLPKRWWLAPSSCHRLLEPAQRRDVLTWFHLGVAAVVLTLAGCGLMLFASMLAWHAG